MQQDSTAVRVTARHLDSRDHHQTRRDSCPPVTRMEHWRRLHLPRTHLCGFPKAQQPYVRYASYPIRSNEKQLEAGNQSLWGSVDTAKFSHFGFFFFHFRGVRLLTLSRDRCREEKKKKQNEQEKNLNFIATREKRWMHKLEKNKNVGMTFNIHIMRGAL